METFLLLFKAVSLLVSNPALGGGGSRASEVVRVIGHITELINGGAKTAAELKAFAEQIHAMAVAAQLPTERDFAAWTVRLNAALTVVEEAKQKLKARGVTTKKAAKAVKEAVDESKKPDPVESPALAALDEATVEAVGEGQDAPLPELDDK